MELTFVGTGVSCAIPVIGHLQHTCACREAIAHPNGPNCRNNVSLLITIPRAPTKTMAPVVGDLLDEHDAPARVLIDCGKTFRRAYFRVLVPRSVRAVDALLITHGHADAMQCVEEVCNLHEETWRLIQQSARAGSAWPLNVYPERALRYVPTYMMRPTMKEVDYIAHAVAERSHLHGEAPCNAAEMAKYLSCLPATGSLGGEGAAALDVFFIREDVPAPVHVPALGDDFPLYSLPVEHGKNYISLGFVFGRGTAFRSSGSGGATREQLEGKSCVVYISDVSDIPPASMKFLDDLVKIDVLVIDLLAEKGSSSPPHYCWDDVMPVVRKLTPRRTLCVGMFCSIEHHAGNREWQHDLKEEKRRVRTQRSDREDGATSQGRNDERDRQFIEQVETIELAFDGQTLQLPL